MYILEIDFQLRSEKRREFNSSVDSLLMQGLRTVVRATTYEDRDDVNRLMLVWEWREQKEVEAYLESESFGALLGCLKTLGTVSDLRVVDVQQSMASSGSPPSLRWVRGYSA